MYSKYIPESGVNYFLECYVESLKNYFTFLDEKCTTKKIWNTAYKGIKKVGLCIKKKLLRKKQNIVHLNIQAECCPVQKKSESTQTIINSVDFS